MCGDKKVRARQGPGAGASCLCVGVYLGPPGCLALPFFGPSIIRLEIPRGQQRARAVCSEFFYQWRWPFYHTGFCLFGSARVRIGLSPARRALAYTRTGLGSSILHQTGMLLSIKPVRHPQHLFRVILGGSCSKVAPLPCQISISKREGPTLSMF